MSKHSPEDIEDDGLLSTDFLLVDIQHYGFRQTLYDTYLAFEADNDHDDWNLYLLMTIAKLPATKQRGMMDAHKNDYPHPLNPSPLPR